MRKLPRLRLAGRRLAGIFARMKIERRRQIEGLIFLAAFALCIPAANWLIGNVGTVCAPGGPCLIPVGPGILAPSSVIAIGLALVLRDLVQRRLGINGALGSILLGTLLSVLIAPTSVVLASVRAFFASIMPAPVWSRSFFTSAAVIAMYVILF